MATTSVSGKERYRARFLEELDGRIDAILSAAATLRDSGLPAIPTGDSEEALALSGAVDDIYRHAHSIRGAAATLDIAPAREAADILAEVALHLNDDGALGNAAVWDLISRAADGLAVFGAACRSGHDQGTAALMATAGALRADFDRHFAPPENAAEDFAEVARMLRLSDEDIAAFGFPTTSKTPAALGARPEADGAATSTEDVAASPPVPAPTPARATEADDASPQPRLVPAADSPHGSDTTLVAERAMPENDAQDAGEDHTSTAGPDGTPDVESLVAHTGHVGLADMPLATEEPAMAAGSAAQGPLVTEAAEVEAPVAAALATPRVITIFCESGLRMLEPVPAALTALAADGRDGAAMRAARRVFHTIKGDGRQIGLEGLAALAEAAEDIFDTVLEARQGESGEDYAVPTDALPLVRRAHDILTRLFGDPGALGRDLPADAVELSQTLRDAARATAEPSGMIGAPQVTPAEERRQRLLPVFLAESRRLIDALHRHIDTLRTEPGDIRALLGATRALHTLKGNATSMNVEVIVSLADGGESLLEQLTLTAEPASPVQLAVLNDLDGALRHVVDALDRGEAYDAAALAPLIAALTNAQADRGAREVPRAASVPAEIAETPPLTVDEMAPLALSHVRLAPRQAPAVPAASEREVIAANGAPETPGTRQRHEPVKPLFAPRSSSVAARGGAERRALTENITSVDLGDVERTVNLFGRIVTARTMIAQGVDGLRHPAGESLRNSQRLRAVVDKLAAEFELVRRERRATAQGDDWDALELETFDSYAQIMLELGEIIADQEEIAGGLGEGVRRTSLLCEGDRETTERLQAALLGFRLVRLATIEPRLDQVITSTARAVGKTVKWELQGGSVAVDKAVLDAVQEPLLHLLRNAIDHGIERADERVARGKDALGTITVAASYGTNSAIIRVSDDGQGIDPEHVAARAVERGMVSAQRAATLDARAKMDLVWHAGFSTATTVTEISGRGVGLDIVRGMVERVRGSVTVESAVGRGATFVLTLPLSLSVVRTLLLRDGDAMAAVPLAQVEGVHLVRKDAITALGDRTVAMVEGRAVTLLERGLARPIALRGRLGGESVVVLQVRVSADRTVGYVVDEVLGEEDTLVKALPRYLQHRPTFVGCSVAGNGRPYAILDVRHLAEQSAGAGTSAGAAVGTLTPAPPAPPMSPLPSAGARTRGPLVLIVDDSLFMRRSLAELYQGGGFRIETAEDGEEALAAIARIGLPDLMSLDMEMPRLNGLETLSVLRQLPGGQGVPVFMVTTRGQERHRRAALEAGATRYFIKPFDGDEVLAAARAECGARTAHKSA